MQRRDLAPVLYQALVLFALVLTLVSGAWAAAREKVLHSFTGAPKDGCWPYAGLVFDALGNLYGTTSGCGTYQYWGTVFELTPSNGSYSETILHSFGSGDDGMLPYGGLVFDPTGNLYGTTIDGALDGTVFELMAEPGGSWAESVLHRFNYLQGDGDQPMASLVLDKAGNLYGTANGGGSHGGGVVFELAPVGDGSWTENLLYSFSANYGDGWSPQAGLIWDGEGNLYSTTVWGGGFYQHCSPGCGTVFELKNVGGVWQEKILHRFNWVPGGRDGEAVYGGVAFDSAGNLYGTTAGGGRNNVGTVFQLTPSPSGWKESVIYTFKPGKSGSFPFAGVVVDSSGNLYGTTASGGIGSCPRGGCGVVYKLTRGGGGLWTYSVLYHFSGGVDGAEPFAGLILDSQGNLYGTTTYGGIGNNGVVFEITP